MATPRDDSSANWSRRPARNQNDAAFGPDDLPCMPGDPNRSYAPHQPQPQQPQAPVPYEQPRPRIQTVDGLGRREESAPSASPDHPLVRPYTMTGGRTRPRYQLALEALVATTVLPHEVQGRVPEHQRICHLCQEIKSVAEISALLTIPLGVARVLVADMAEAGLVTVHQPGGDEDGEGPPDVTLLERVLSGLRKL